MNLYVEIGNFLKGKNCLMYPSAMKVSTPGRDAYIYPDASIICDEAQLEDDKSDTLINPTVVFEILSPSTRKNDVGYKLLWYRQIPSLKEYITIDSTKKFVQTVRRQPDGDWRFEDITDISAQFTIPSINFNISLDEIYRDSVL